MMLITGCKPIDIIINGLRSDACIQLVGDDETILSEVAIHFMKHMKIPAYFDMRNTINKKQIDRVRDDEVIVVREENGDVAMDILIYLLSNALTDGVIVDDIPSIVSSAERDGTGDEYDSLKVIKRAMIRSRQYCIRHGIPIVWMNQLRYDDRVGTRTFGGSMLTPIMGLTIACQKRRNIYRNQRYIGVEAALRVIDSHHKYARRHTFIGVFDDCGIDEAYWAYKEAQRYKIINRVPGGCEYEGQLYRHWKLVDQLRSNENILRKLEREIDNAEKEKNFY